MESKIGKESISLSRVTEYVAPDEGSGVLVLEDVGQFYASRRRSLFGQAFALVRNRALAEDLTQEAFARLVAEVKSGNAIQSAVRWTSTVLRNLALNHLEHTKVVSRVLEPDAQTHIDEATDDALSAEETYLAKEARTQLQNSLSKLAPLERECILMFAEGYSYKEIALKKNLNYGVAVDVVRRSLRKLRKRLPASQG